ncbi:MAG: saccharopine dehydrogenase NADP-binding domain-containing protein [Ignavibacteriaceae bacterium]
MNNILILGGYGFAGSETAKILLKHTDCNITLAGRNLDKACKKAKELNQSFSCNRIKGLMLDAGNINDMAEKMKAFDLVIVCIPLAALGDNVAKAAIKAEINYIDLNLNDKKQKTLKDSAGLIKKKGLTFISEAGLVPGTPAFMLRLLHKELPSLNEVAFSGYFNEKVVTIGSCEDIIKEASTKPLILQEGKWIETSSMKGNKIDFGGEVGLKKCYPLRMMEIEDLALRLSLNKCSVYSAGIGGMADLIMVIWSIFKLYKKESRAKIGAKLLYRAANKNRKPPYITIVQAKGNGKVNSENREIILSLSHPNGWIGTAIPVAACVLQLLDGTINKPGLFRMGELVEVERFKNDISNLGIEMKIVIK